MLRDQRRSPETSMSGKTEEPEPDPRETSLEPETEAGTRRGIPNHDWIWQKNEQTGWYSARRGHTAQKDTDRARPREEDLLVRGIAWLDPEQSVLRAKCSARNQKAVLSFWCAKSDRRNVGICSISGRNRGRHEPDGRTRRSSVNRPCVNKKSRTVGAARKEKHIKQRLCVRKAREQRVMAGA